MATSVADRYRRWFAYEQDAHARVLASLETVPEDRRSSPAYDKALMLLGHLAAARQIWLYRFGVTKEPPSDFFPKGLPLAEAASRIQAAQQAWARYFERLNDAELARTFEYESLDGGRWRSQVEDILAQLFGHSSYHRGQIATLVREAGGEPAVTDFVYWTREPAP